MKFKGKIALSAAIMGLAIGCATTAQKGALSFMRTDFARGEYQKCLGDIERSRRYTDLEPKDNAEGDLTEALCREQLGDQGKADEIYRQILKQFPNTSFAFRAQARLNRMEGDQKEQVVPEFDGREWFLVSRQWSNQGFIRQFRPDRARKVNEVVTVISTDRSASAVAPSDCLTVFLAEMRLTCPEASIHRESRPRGSFLFSFETGPCGKTRSEQGVGRIIMTRSRVHMMLYAVPQAGPYNKLGWLDLLHKATIKDSPVERQPVRPGKGVKTA